MDLLSENGFKHVSEYLKQGITTKSAKIHRYSNSNKQFRQNTLFETNRSNVYAGHSGDQRFPEMTLHLEEAKQFWENVWGEVSAHQQGVEWLKK